MNQSDNILLSVIVCTHNPRFSYLAHILEALQMQTLPLPRWELLLIDNNSKDALAGRVDLGWHPNGRHLCEKKTGLTNARLRGFAEACGEILVLVDDDTVLAFDYLTQALAIANAHPELGVWGGNIALCFDEPPPEWTERYWPFLAEQIVHENVMAKSVALCGPLPSGAGCCVRRAVAKAYAEQVAGSEVRRNLDRNGVLLTSGGDTDLVLTACALGFSRGLFKTLRLKHLIPPHRLTEDYLLRLVAGIRLSNCILSMIHPPHKPPPRINWWWWVKFCCDCTFKYGRKRRFYIANKRAQRQARAIYERQLL